jgi:hypothetical protein
MGIGRGRGADGGSESESESERERARERERAGGPLHRPPLLRGRRAVGFLGRVRAVQPVAAKAGGAGDAARAVDCGNVVYIHCFILCYIISYYDVLCVW